MNTTSVAEPNIAFMLEPNVSQQLLTLKPRDEIFLSFKLTHNRIPADIDIYPVIWLDF